LTYTFESLKEWGWNDYWAAQAESLAITEGEVARVVGHDRDLWTIRSERAVLTARVTSSDDLETRPAVGDWVFAVPGPLENDPWSISGVLPRRSQISRGEAGTGRSEQILASNIDKIWIVTGLDTDLNLRRLERYLAVTWDSGAVPEIILTKTDLHQDLDAVLNEVESVALGVTVHMVSSKDGESVQRLRSELILGETICLLGPSGVGKSTLINALAAEEVARTGEVREGDSKGRHTTTRRELFRIPGGACLLDTPGIRELRVWIMEDGLANTFPDVEALAGGCRFNDCSHGSEPGCAVVGAVESGHLEAGRLNSYRKLQAEAAYEKRRDDPRARAAEVSRWKAVKKSMKKHPKHRNRS